MGFEGFFNDGVFGYLHDLLRSELHDPGYLGVKIASQIAFVNTPGTGLSGPAATSQGRRAVMNSGTSGILSELHPAVTHHYNRVFASWRAGRYRSQADSFDW
jgi:hypothetical protein